MSGNGKESVGSKSDRLEWRTRRQNNSRYGWRRAAGGGRGTRRGRSLRSGLLRGRGLSRPAGGERTRRELRSPRPLQQRRADHHLSSSLRSNPACRGRGSRRWVSGLKVCSRRVSIPHPVAACGWSRPWSIAGTVLATSADASSSRSTTAANPETPRPWRCGLLPPDLLEFLRASLCLAVRHGDDKIEVHRLHSSSDPAAVAAAVQVVLKRSWIDAKRTAAVAAGSAQRVPRLRRPTRRRRDPSAY
jgi:hypothetical protein